MENETKKEESADQLVLMKVANLNDVNQNLKDVIAELKKVDHLEIAKSIVQSLGILSKELQLKLGDVEKAAKKELPAIPQPNISVKAPQVTVDAPDLSGIEKLLNTRLPEIVKQMTDAIPEVPETDLGKVEKLLNDLLMTMAEVRDRKIPVPQMPTTLKVTNTDGSSIAIRGLAGASTDVTLTLTNAATSYQVPVAPPLSAYLLLLYNGSDTDMFITFTSNTTGGVKLAAGANLNIDLGANQTVFAYCSGTGKVLNTSFKVI